jgi:hypothetical protein
MNIPYVQKYRIFTRLSIMRAPQSACILLTYIYLYIMTSQTKVAVSNIVQY